VHRTQFKSRPSLISIDKGVTEITPEGSPSISPSTSSSGKSSVPRPYESTGKTSLDWKFSSASKAISQHSSENKKLVTKQGLAGDIGSNELPLTPIAEVESVEAPKPVPSMSMPILFQITHLNRVILSILQRASGLGRRGVSLHFKHSHSLTYQCSCPHCREGCSGQDLLRMPLQQCLRDDSSIYPSPGA
jgi:hypothetical protein